MPALLSAVEMDAGLITIGPALSLLSKPSLRLLSPAVGFWFPVLFSQKVL